MNTVYMAFAVFLLVTAYNYLKPKYERQYVSLKTEQAYELLRSNPEVILIDVREREEYQRGHIKGARNIPLPYLEKRLSLPLDKDIVVYCQNGAKSIRAIRVLEVAGYTRLYHMHEGLRGWLKAGYPLI